MKKHFNTLYLLLTMSCITQAQSYHFSQFFSTPLLTNPAHTGLMDGSFRVASNFRSQGSSSGNPYFTGYLSADISPFKKALTTGHKAGLGLYVMDDQSLNGALQTSTIGFSGAYNVGLDAYGQRTLGVGFQGTYNQRRIDYSKLSFENQFGVGGFNPSLPIGEGLGNVNKNYFDVNAGILYNAVLENKSFFAGVSVYNILNHKDNQLPDNFKMPVRYTVQAGLQYNVSEYSRIYGSFTNMTQAKANETTVGGAYGLQLREGTVKDEINAGLWYRYKDALIPYIGYTYDGLRVGLSYDNTVSSLKTGAQVKNGFELTLMYKIINKKILKTTVPWY